MNKIVVGFLSAVGLFVIFPADAYAHHTNSQHRGAPAFERTISPGENAVLAHTKSPAKHTICQLIKDGNHAIIHYDDNEMTLGPGHCVMVEASYISASPSGDSPVSVFGFHNTPRHLHAGE
jgi:hypothetical protein